MANAPEQADHVLLETEGLVVTESTFVQRELGVIAKRDYHKGEVLFTVKGPVKSEPSKYSLAIGLDKHIEPESEHGGAGLGHYTNHSCDPTAFARVVYPDNQDPFIEITARKDLKAGDELTFDYASLEYEITAKGQPCKCGAGVCRGVMHGFKDLPHHIAKQYKEEGIIPQHLADLVPEAPPTKND